MNKAERFFMDLVEDGTLSIDNEGRIWRHYYLQPIVGKMKSLVKTERVKLKESKRAECVERRYFRLGTLRNGHSIHASAHRLVYIYFFGDAIDGYEVDHVNGNKKDNRPDNLEKVTGHENKIRAGKNGLLSVSHHVTVPRPKGEDASRAKLTWEKVRQIRNLSGVLTQDELAAQFDVSRTNISAIVTKRSWKE